jgi:hypothetical protein
MHSTRGCIHVASWSDPDPDTCYTCLLLHRGRTWSAFSGAQLLSWLADHPAASSQQAGAGAGAQTSPQAVAASLLAARLITPTTGPSSTSSLPSSSSSVPSTAGNTPPFHGSTSTPSTAGQGAQQQQQQQPPAVNPGEWYSLASEAPPVPAGQPLNTRLWWAGPARPAAQVRPCASSTHRDHGHQPI